MTDQTEPPTPDTDLSHADLSHADLPDESDPVDPALASAVLEIEAHVAGEGWDRPARLYALVETADVVAREPDLAAQLGLDDTSAEGSFTPIEQDYDPAVPLEETLRSIMWPPSVTGCAAVVERLVLPPGADSDLPDDPAAAQEFAAAHPDRQEVRMVAGATRAGATYCALRLRAHDDDQSVVGGTDLVPALVELVRGTLIEDEEGQAS